MKKKILTFLLIITAFFITGCTAKESMHQDEFKKIMEGKSFQVTDMTEEAKQTNGGVEYCYYAENHDGRYTIEYYSFDSEMSAQAFYAQKQVAFTSTGAQANTELNTGNYSKYTQTFKGKYGVISRVSNTVIYLNVDSNYSEEIKTLLKDIGY